MKSTIQEPSPTRRALEVEIPAEEVLQEIEKTTRRFAREVNLPGFRKGKAPTSVVRQRFGEEIRGEVIERLTKEASWKIIEEEDLIPVTAPTVEEHSYKDGEPLIFRTVFEIRPHFELGKYKGLEVVGKRPVVDDEVVEKHLESLREQGARLEPVLLVRALVEGDVPVVDMQRLGLDGEPDGEPQVGVVLDLRPDSSPAELGEGLIGMNVGETRELSIPGPKSGEEEALSTRYRATLTALKKRALPDLDDAFAKDVGNFESLDALRKRLREDLDRRADDRAEQEVRQQVMEQLVEKHSFTAPEALVEHELNRMIEQMIGAMAQQGLDPSQAGVDWKSKRQELSGAAERRARADLILEEVAREEKLEVTDKEVLGALQHEAQREKTTPAQLMQRLEEEGRLSSLKMSMLRDKALDLVAGSANIMG